MIPPQIRYAKFFCYLKKMCLMISIFMSLHILMLELDHIVILIHVKCNHVAGCIVILWMFFNDYVKINWTEFSLHVSFYTNFVLGVIYQLLRHGVPCNSGKNTFLGYRWVCLKMWKPLEGNWLILLQRREIDFHI